MKKEKDLYSYEDKYIAKGCNIIAGVDEAGRGPWAGPLTVAICILPLGYKNDEINDSKLLSAAKREKLFDVIVNDALAYQIINVDSTDIDKEEGKGGIKLATKKAMKKLIESIKPTPDIVLIDGEKIDTKINTESFFHADQLSISVAAASILAKVSRDKYMDKIDRQYPQYKFAKNKGYGTKIHLDALKKYGPIKDIHRFSYKPVKNAISISKH